MHCASRYPTFVSALCGQYNSLKLGQKRESSLPYAKHVPTTDMSMLPPGFQRSEASLSKDPYHYKIFDIQDTDLSNICSSIHTLALGPSYASRRASTKQHLQPITDAADRSTSPLGSLTSSDVKKLHKHGSCTHNKIVVLLLEPTKHSEETIHQIGSLLRSASKGVLDEHNTAIINCRALIPNASYNENYADDSK